MKHRRAQRRNEGFRSILERAVQADAPALARKSLAALRLSRITQARSRKICLMVHAALVSQLVRIGAATPSRALAGPPGIVRLDLLMGGRIAIPIRVLDADAIQLLYDWSDLDRRDAA